MTFEKIGSPQPISIINRCSCGNEATIMINGEMYCDDCVPDGNNNNMELTSNE